CGAEVAIEVTPIVITIPSHPRHLSIVRAAALLAAEIYGMTTAEAEDIRHAVDEACSNVIKYAYKCDCTRKITVKFQETQTTFQVTIEDAGCKASMDDIKIRELDEIRPGGLGIHFIKKAFDVVAFDKKKRTGNRLLLTRYKNMDRQAQK
ncbi:MAG: ATP-binding protein, partial [Candidatus Magnetominusculus sp. LBB02]|nr:ATP-binding protein [Candidatus Magnetominusculus sp. LBB02]